jgi:hypothetical protein
MLVRLEQTDALAEVAAYLRGFDCRVSFGREGTLDVAFAPCANGDPSWLERIRLEGYVRTWNALHPTAQAVIGD